MVVLLVLLVSLVLEVSTLLFNVPTALLALIQQPLHLSALSVPSVLIQLLERLPALPASLQILQLLVLERLFPVTASSQS